MTYWSSRQPPKLTSRPASRFWSCTSASTACASSELQFADGMAKQAAAGLLAQRLRSHVCDHANFTASKKKSLDQRRQSQARCATQSPSQKNCYTQPCAIRLRLQRYPMGHGSTTPHARSTAQLTPSEATRQKLHLQKQAAIAVIEADNDSRLREHS